MKKPTNKDGLKYNLIGLRLTWLFFIISAIFLWICSFPTKFNILYPLFLVDLLVSGFLFLFFQIKVCYFAQYEKTNRRTNRR